MSEILLDDFKPYDSYLVTLGEYEIKVVRGFSTCFRKLPAVVLYIGELIVGIGDARPASLVFNTEEHVNPTPFSVDKLWRPEFISVRDEYQGKGIGKLLYYALADTCRLKDSGAVLIPFDLIYRHKEDYGAGLYGTSESALNTWKSFGKDWI